MATMGTHPFLPRSRPGLRFAQGAALSLLLAPALAAAERPSLRAVPVSQTEAVVLDGRLNDAVWRSAPAASSFVQREPRAGLPATEPTEVRLAFTPTTLYVGIRAVDSEPRALVARAMERDADTAEEDSIALMFDTFLDRRNGYFFATNSNGVRTDALISDDGDDVNLEWDGVWEVAARRTEEGWAAEMAIPFSTLRFAPGASEWGLNIRRIVRRKGEEAFWAPLPVEADGGRVSLYGRLTGLEGMTPGLNLRVKPFAVTKGKEGAESERAMDDQAGLDVKWGIGRGMALDLTVNTDFAESEADEQQVNLSRFSLFLPEKREFFLENAGIFEFGPRTPFGPQLFRPFNSRRVGLSPQGMPVPIEWGTRLTGRSGPWSLGVLDAQTGPGADRDGEGDNWGVVRAKRQIGNTSVGLLSTRHGGDDGVNSLYGADVDIQATPRLKLRSFWAMTDDPREGSDQTGGLAAVYRGPVWRWSLDALEIGGRFDPEMGFLRRRGVRRYASSLTFVPRPEISGVRNLFFEGRSEVYTDLDGEVESIAAGADLFSFRTFQNDVLSLYGDHTFERLAEPFEIRDGVVIPPGEYGFEQIGLWGETNPSRRVSAEGWVQQGDFYGGERLAHGLKLRLAPSRHLRWETSWDHNDIDLPQGSFTTDLFRQRIAVPLTPDLSTAAFAQWSDAAELLSVNLRFGWSYKPGADLFLVFNQTWDAPEWGQRSQRDRQAILKVTYLFAA